MSRIVYLNEARVHILTATAAHVMQLQPGRNVVDDEVFNQVEKHSPEFRDMVEKELIIVQGEAVDITKLSAAKAIQLIELESTVAGVEDLLDQELKSEKSRKTVLEAAEAKITAIKQAETDAANEAAKKKVPTRGGSDNAG
jgi:Arc/MetJ family transcription regulator